MVDQVKICPQCKLAQPLAETVCTNCGHKFRTLFPSVGQTQAIPTVQAPVPAAQPPGPMQPNIPAQPPGFGQPPIPQMPFGYWFFGWIRYLAIRVGLPALAALALFIGYQHFSKALAHTVVGNWESVDTSFDMVMVLNKDGTGWRYFVDGPDDDIRWKINQNRLELKYSSGTTMPVGYALSDDGQQMTLRIEGHIIRMERIQGDPPPRPSKTPGNQANGI